MTATNPDKRPEPQALLSEAQKEGRGRLKLFLGMAPGVGKTYAMLQAAQQRRTEGRDVVVGVVETHGRRETEALCAGLEMLPRRSLTYRGRNFEEMDLDGLLARKPEIALVDELAHSNIEGARHTKRYHDVEELLDAGIDVYSTLNIQHLDSLTDVIQRITGVVVRETLPDSVLLRADEIELVDLPPDELIQRLREGKVYLGEQAYLAIQNFFSRGNLTALREIALRTAAERVDRDVIDYLKTHAGEERLSPRDRLLVCIDGKPNANRLIRTAARMASRARIPWIALHIESRSDAAATEKEKNTIAEAMSLAGRLGAETMTMRGGTGIADDIIAFARSRFATRILIGRTHKPAIVQSLLPTVSGRLLARAGEFEVTLLRDSDEDADTGGGANQVRRLLTSTGSPRFGEFLPPTLAVAIALAVSSTLHQFLPLANLSLVFLMPVLYAGVRHGLWPSVYTVFLSFAAYNFFFTEPRYTFLVNEYGDVITLLFYLIAAVITGNIAVRIRTQIEALQTAAVRSSLMHDFSRRLATALTFGDAARDITRGIAQSLHRRAALLMPDHRHPGHLAVVSSDPEGEVMQHIDLAAADWAFKNDKPAGLGSDTLPGATWLFTPLKRRDGPLGLIAVAPLDADVKPSPLDGEQGRMLHAFSDQAALALDRAMLAIDIEESRLASETEKLRTALLSSISHDLRTPLSSIIGSATTLSSMEAALSADNRAELVQTVLQEAHRLNRFVQNLLDMTKLGQGKLAVRRVWIGDIRDVLGRATARLQRELRPFKVNFKIRNEVSNLYVDPVLFEQVMVNILENAAKYSKPGTRIEIMLEKRGSRVVLEVEDQGPGIPPADRDKVFDMFYRVRAGDSKVAGTGLGLAICRGFVEAHGGSIRAEAGFNGKGTAILIEFPARYARPQTFLGKMSSDQPPDEDATTEETRG
jgi:two-component system sensor histidine kinase KdpD